MVTVTRLGLQRGEKDHDKGRLQHRPLQWLGGDEINDARNYNGWKQSRLRHGLRLDPLLVHAAPLTPVRGLLVELAL